MKRLIFFVLLLVTVLTSNFLFAKTWQDITWGLRDREFYAIAEGNGEGTIYVGTCDGLYSKSEDRDEWARIFASRGKNKGVNHIYADKLGALYVATGNGLYKSHDFGKSWKRLFSGLGEENYATRVICDKKTCGKIYLGTVKGLFWTENDGKIWKKAGGVLGNSKIDSIAQDEENVFLIANNGLYKISKNLENYKKVFGSHSPEGLAEDGTTEIDEEKETDEAVFLLNNLTVNEEALYLSTNRGLFISKDCGAKWMRFNDSGLTRGSLNDILLLGSNSELYAATGSGVFKYISDDNKWSGILAGMDSANVKRLLATKTKSSIWALCDARVYKMDLDNFNNPEEKAPDKAGIMSNFTNEPTINEAQAMAIRYAEVHPEKIEEWRRGAKLKALFPRVSFGIDHANSDTYEIYTSSSNSYWVNGPKDKTDGWDLNFSWDLGDLVWNESQTGIDVRSKLMVQLRDDIINEITRVYFERRRLQVENLTNPPETLQGELEYALRMQELTATLDGLTGSRFSRAIEEREKN